MNKVLVTGGTGFLGSHVVEALIENDYEVLALKRRNSDCWRCKEVYDKIQWIDIDESSLWKKEVENLAPSFVIHSAWIGVEAKDRDNYELQLQNIKFLLDLLEIVRKVDIQKFIVFGSQAEYGALDAKATENDLLKPNTAYGCTKVVCSEILKLFCEQRNDLDWIWFRLFSVYGEKEGSNWLLPSVINKLKSNVSIELTEGEQKAAYLYIKDFVKMLIATMQKKVLSGVYNVSNIECYSLKQIIQKTRDIIRSSSDLEFGKLPYRMNQSMHLEGDMTKLISQIGKVDFTSLEDGLNKTIEYYT